MYVPLAVFSVAADWPEESKLQASLLAWMDEVVTKDFMQYKLSSTPRSDNKHPTTTEARHLTPRGMLIVFTIYECVFI
jgi:hypothetical protein